MLSGLGRAVGEEKEAKFADSSGESGGREVEREGLVDGPGRLGEGAKESGEGIPLGFGELMFGGRGRGRGGEVEPDLVRVERRGRGNRRLRRGEEVGGGEEERGGKGMEAREESDGETRRGAAEERGEERCHRRMGNRCIRVGERPPLEGR